MPMHPQKLAAIMINSGPIFRFDNFSIMCQI
jgi:hypothetical protein